MEAKDKLTEKLKELIGHFKINYIPIKASPGSNFQPVHAKNITRKLESEIAAFEKQVEEQESALNIAKFSVKVEDGEIKINQKEQEYNLPPFIFCPGCGKDWELDSDEFGCWSCGYSKVKITMIPEKLKPNKP